MWELRQDFDVASHVAQAPQAVVLLGWAVREFMREAPGVRSDLGAAKHAASA